MSPQVGQIALLVYAALLIGGGVMGFVKARSRPSLIAGTLSGLVALAAAALARFGASPRAGLVLGLALSFVMALMFLRRFGSSRKFMPSGLLALASLVLVVLLVAVLTTG